MADMEALIRKLSKTMAQAGMARSARLQVASRLDPARPAGRPWSLAGLAGRAVLLTGPARLSSALLLVHQAQRRHSVPLWIAATDSTFYPPDAARMGLDLAALPLVRLSEADHHRLLWRILRRVLVSEAFSLVILDGAIPKRDQARRIARTAAEHGTALVFIAPPSSDTISARHQKIPMVSTRRVRLDGETFLAQFKGLHWSPSPGSMSRDDIRLAALPELTIPRR